MSDEPSRRPGLTYTVNVLNVPELIFLVRRECAEMLRYEADTESDPRMARRLRALAADFEVSGLWLDSPPSDHG